MSQRKLIDPIYVYADPMKGAVHQPPVVIAIAGAAAATFGPALFGAAFATIGSLGVFTSFLVRAALGIALYALSPKPKPPTSSASGYRVTANGSALDHQIVYGAARCGGVRIYDASSGADNSRLHRVIAFTGHEIDSFNKIYANDEEITFDPVTGNVTSPARYNGYMRVFRALGTDDQEALPRMVEQAPQWTSEHRLRGIAYLYLEFDYNQDVFPNGVPEVTALVRGKKVYDPRTGLTAWTDNAALCIRDYLVSPYGLAVPSSKIDDVLFQVAANVCDEDVVDGAVTQKRYTCNGNYTTASAPIDVLQGLVTALGGIIWYAQGKWRTKAAKWTSPIKEITQDDFRSGIQIVTRNSRRDNFNVVKGTYRGDATNWQQSDYTSVSETVFVEQDGGTEVTSDLDLAFTNNNLACQRIARIALRRNREQMAFSTSLGLAAFGLQVGDNITITNPRYGWVSKTFELMSWSFTITDDFDIVFPVALRETSSAVFDSQPGEVIIGNDTQLPDPFNVPEVGISVFDDLKQINEAVIPVVYIDVTASSPFVDSVEVQYKLSSSSEWIRVGRGPVGRFEVIGVEDGFYDFRTRATTVLGIRAETWSEITNRYISPFAAPPSDVTNFNANVVGGDVHLTWVPVPDLDLSHYKIKHSPLTTGASYSNALEVVDRVARPANNVVVPARTGTYFIKAVDKLGTQSNNPAVTVVFTNMENFQNLNVVEVLTQEPDFAGVGTGVSVSINDGIPSLVLGTSLLFDSALGNFDDYTGLFDGGGGTVVSEGFYEFAEILDLGEKYTSRVSAVVISNRIGLNSFFDDETVLFDEKSGLFDGDSDSFNDSVVGLEVSYTDDDPLGTPVWSAWAPFFVSDISARALRFRASLRSSDPWVSPSITNLSVTVDMPDRVESGEDIVFTGSTTVTFPQPFRQAPSVGVTLANLTSGQRYGILSKTRTGFVVEIRNSDNSLASNPVQMDYVAKGFGRGM